jgi:excisionase family DNA binding protein
MSVVITSRKEEIDDENKPQSGYMTTTELARLCGVSRFTIINWTRQGKIKAIRTVGRHYRIPVSEALSLLRTLGMKEQASSANLQKPCRQKVPTTKDDEERGNCLTSRKKNKQVMTKKKNVLYAFGYSVSRGVNVLKGRSKDK